MVNGAVGRLSVVKINDNALKCPICGEKISIRRKASFTVNWVYEIRCNHCSERIKLSKWAFVFRVINASFFILPIIFMTMTRIVASGLFGMYLVCIL